MDRVSDGVDPYTRLWWQYVPADQLKREITEVLLEGEVKKALVKLNPGEVIQKLRAILLSVENLGLVSANEEFALWLKGREDYAFWQNWDHVSVRLIDFEQYGNNSYILTNQFVIRARENKRPDIFGSSVSSWAIAGEAQNNASIKTYFLFITEMGDFRSE